MVSYLSWEASSNTDSKLSIPSRTYNASVAHSRQILGNTYVHPATSNDITLVVYNKLIRGINDGELCSD